MGQYLEPVTGEKMEMEGGKNSTGTRRGPVEGVEYRHPRRRAKRETSWK